ncbi:uncharacterized protein LOC122258638 [Penaeus japonicus]|uniref:uncharacterized protein LOC122258638 n=1 Tax=Penaeus japonicus TaxID=27405 RepID=UPI001C7175BA|nr:uncharacterized protein LOC122258638 [Penaeus japonicus]
MVGVPVYALSSVIMSTVLHLSHQCPPAPPLPLALEVKPRNPQWTLQGSVLGPCARQGHPIACLALEGQDGYVSVSLTKSCQPELMADIVPFSSDPSGESVFRLHLTHAPFLLILETKKKSRVTLIIHQQPKNLSLEITSCTNCEVRLGAPRDSSDDLWNDHDPHDDFASSEGPGVPLVHSLLKVSLAVVFLSAFLAVFLVVLICKMHIFILHSDTQCWNAN